MQQPCSRDSMHQMIAKKDPYTSGKLPRENADLQPCSRAMLQMQHSANHTCRSTDTLSSTPTHEPTSAGLQQPPSHAASTAVPHSHTPPKPQRSFSPRTRSFFHPRTPATHEQIHTLNPRGPRPQRHVALRLTFLVPGLLAGLLLGLPPPAARAPPLMAVS